MSKKPPIRNLVHKHSVEFNKPKTFRNRKKEYARKQKYEDFELEHPKHQPYKRTTKEKFEDEEDEFEEEGDEEEERE